VADHWVTPGIVVKVIAKEPAQFYKQKGVITQLDSKYIARVKLLETGQVLRLDQAHLETVLPGNIEL